LITYRFYACVLAFCLALSTPLAIWAEDAVSPPPEATPKVEPTATATASEDDQSAVERPAPSSSATSEDANLKKALVPDNIGKNVSIHAYTRQDDKAEISEYSMNGRVYMVKVKPAGAIPAYYLYDDNGDGTFNKRLPGNYKHLNPPGWVLATF